MSQHKVKVSQVINDFRLTMDGDDYASNVSDVALRNFALRGIREIGFDLGRKIKSVKLEIKSNNTVALPNDFVGLSKVGVVDEDGIVRVFGENRNINYSRRYNEFAEGNGADTILRINNQYNINDANSGGLAESADVTSIYQQGDHDITQNRVLNTVADKTSTTSGSTPDDGDLSFYIFENYLYQGGSGRLYGMGGGNLAGDYRLNLDENRIEIDTNSGETHVIVEYVADEARSNDPEVHTYAEEALRSYMYYKIIERKSSVPNAEKARARQEYYNERRKANARLSTFTKDEALKTIRKNFMQAPKY